MENYLFHHGIKGQKWGIRRFQNEDGSLTQAGRRRYSMNENSSENSSSKKFSKLAKAGAIVAGTALAAYGTYKVAEYLKEEHSQKALNKAKEYLDKNFLDTIGKTKFSNGEMQFNFKSKDGSNSLVIRGSRDSALKEVGKNNAKAVATARKIYSDSLDTKFDKGLDKIVDSGNVVKSGLQKSGEAVKNGAEKARYAAKVGINKVGTVIKRSKDGNTRTETKIEDVTSKYKDIIGPGMKVIEEVNYKVTNKKRK